MTRRVLLFVGTTTAIWLLIAIPCRLWWGDTLAVYGLIAMLLCLVPGTLTLAWTCWAQEHSPQTIIVPAMAGTGIRLATVLLGSIVLKHNVEYLQQSPGFLAWVVFFYLLTLGLEIGFLVAGQERDAKSPGAR